MEILSWIKGKLKRTKQEGGFTKTQTEKTTHLEGERIYKVRPWFVDFQNDLYIVKRIENRKVIIDLQTVNAEEAYEHAHLANLVYEKLNLLDGISIHNSDL
jgi:hypothetical protein